MRFIIELDPSKDKELLDIILSAVEGFKRAKEAKTTVQPEPEPEPIQEAKPPRKRRTTVNKRKPKPKPAKRKLVETPIEPEIPEKAFDQAEENLDDYDEVMKVATQAAEEAEQIAGENKHLPDENDVDPEPEDADAILQAAQKPGKVVELPIEKPPPEPVDHNAIFSALVQRSQEAAIALLQRHKLSRFSDAKDETLTAMMHDAQGILQNLK